MTPFPSVFDFDHPCAEVNSDCEVVLGPEALVGELHKEAGLANTSVSDDNVFKQERVGHLNSLSEYVNLLELKSFNH